MSLKNVLWGAPRISAVFITNIAESRFSAHTPPSTGRIFITPPSMVML
ncbi:MAG: hypothetical protein WBG18_28970 [Xanthobacteraceae bacterium]